MSRKILLADDSITIQKVVELVLAEEDYEIKSVSNGEDALNLIDEFKVDIVLADIEMPKINGYQLCEKIKQNPKTANIPVILLAGAFEPVDEDLARQVGADDTVIKPFESQELISKINAAFTVISAEEQEKIEAEGLGAEVLEVLEESEGGVEPEGLGEEVLEVLEESEGGVEPEGLEEDLWAMEETTELPEKWDVETVLEKQKAETEETLEAPEEAVAGEPEPTATEEIAEPKAGKEVVLPEIQIPSKEELLKIFEKSIDEKVSSFLSAVDIRESLLSSLTPLMKDSIEKVLWEVTPGLVEEVLKEILKSSAASFTTELEKIIWETVPDLAGTMISKEIERIKSDF